MTARIGMALLALLLSMAPVGGGLLFFRLLGAKWLLRRLREPSTWRGMVWLATVAGLSLRPDQAEAIVAAGMALAGLLGVFLADEPKSVTVPALPPIELQGRADAGDAGVDAGAVRAVDGLRRPVPSDPGAGEKSAPGRDGWNG